MTNQVIVEMWFNYTDVQHALTPIETEAHLRDFAAALKWE
jgi:hypothetical protein